MCVCVCGMDIQSRFLALNIVILLNNRSWTLGCNMCLTTNLAIAMAVCTRRHNRGGNRHKKVQFRNIVSVRTRSLNTLVSTN